MTGPPILKRTAKRVLRNMLQTLAYRLKSPPYPVCRRFYSVLFVCHGNICRSAYAHYALRRKARGRGVDIRSCGLAAQGGGRPPAEALGAARELGVDLREHYASSVRSVRIDEVDLILPMEYSHFKRIIAMFPQKRNSVMLLRAFAPFPSSVFCNIDDPYGSDIEVYCRCFRLIDGCLEGFLRRFHVGRK